MTDPTFAPTETWWPTVTPVPTSTPFPTMSYYEPTYEPTAPPTWGPSESFYPTSSLWPSASSTPTTSAFPTSTSSSSPTSSSSLLPSSIPTTSPTVLPSSTPSQEISHLPTRRLSLSPTETVSLSPSFKSAFPSSYISVAPTQIASFSPSTHPTTNSHSPTEIGKPSQTLIQTLSVQSNPTSPPKFSSEPSAPTITTDESLKNLLADFIRGDHTDGTVVPSSGNPTSMNTSSPTSLPTFDEPTFEPTVTPLPSITPYPTASSPTSLPTFEPTFEPTVTPLPSITAYPTASSPTSLPTFEPTFEPTVTPLPSITPYPTASSTPTTSAFPTHSAIPTASDTEEITADKYDETKNSDSGVVNYESSNESNDSTIGLSRSCPNYVPGPTLVDHYLTFTYMVESSNKDMGFLATIERHLMDDIAINALKCDSGNDIVIVDPKQGKGNENSNIQIFSISYPSDNAPSQVRACEPTYGETCWIMKTAIFLTIPFTTSVAAARYEVLSHLRKQLDDGSLMTTEFPELAYSKYLGPDPVVGDRTDTYNNRGDGNIDQGESSGLATAVTVTTVLAVTSVLVFFICCLAVRRHERSKHVRQFIEKSTALSIDDDSSLLSRRRSQSRKTDISTAEQEIAELLSLSRQRLQSIPPPISYDEQDANEMKPSKLSKTPDPTLYSSSGKPYKDNQRSRTNKHAVGRFPQKSASESQGLQGAKRQSKPALRTTKKTEAQTKGGHGSNKGASTKQTTTEPAECITVGLQEESNRNFGYPTFGEDLSEDWAQHDEENGFVVSVGSYNSEAKRIEENIGERPAKITETLERARATLAKESHKASKNAVSSDTTLKGAQKDSRREKKSKSKRSAKKENTYIDGDESLYKYEVDFV